jgi:hypothetical protein
MSEDKTFLMMKTLKERQDKFIYYIAGLNVAAIGFTLSKTFDLDIYACHHIYLGLAIVCWLVSTICSFRWIFIQFRSMVGNMDVLELIKGHYDKSKVTEEEKKNLMLASYAKLQEYTDKGEKAMKGMLALFIVGVVFFILWRVFDLL